MDCEQLKFDIAAGILSGQGPAEPALTSHLEVCAGCRKEEAELRRTVELMSSLRGETLSARQPTEAVDEERRAYAVALVVAFVAGLLTRGTVPHQSLSTPAG